MNDGEQSKHEMVLGKTLETGAQEWYCPVCGRRFIMNWPPNYKRIILVPGDEYATHVGGRGGVSMNSPEVKEAIYPEPSESNEPTDTLPINAADLSPWIKWMDDVKFEDLWDRDN